MAWKRLMMKKSKVLGDQSVKFAEEVGAVPKGYVPLLVGSEGEGEERFLVHVSLFKNSCMSKLLDMAAREFGYAQQGILRIPCHAEHFRCIVHEIAKTR